MAAWRLLASLAAALASGAAAGQAVSLSGSFGSNALLVIDGKPRSVAVGSSSQGVRLVSVSANEAVVEIAGKRVALQMGGTPVNLGAVSANEGGNQIVLTSESGGHFITAGTINGKQVRFVVDTGATNVALSQSEAERIGLDFKNSPRGFVQTANGAVPAYRVSLGAVRIGDVQIYNVDATVVPAGMPYVLLGNSFLSRFQMRRENDRMTLDKRY